MHEHQVGQMDPPHGGRARHDRAVRAEPGARSEWRRRSSPTARRATATISAARDEFKLFTNINSTIVDPKNFDPNSFVEVRASGLLHHPAQLLRPGAHRRILPHPAQRADRLPRQEHLCALRHHRQRHALRAGVGRLRDAGVFQHHAAARQDLRQRGLRPGASFSKSDEVCETSYKDRGGKYQGQVGVTFPKI